MATSSFREFLPLPEFGYIITTLCALKFTIELQFSQVVLHVCNEKMKKAVKVKVALYKHKF